MSFIQPCPGCAATNAVQVERIAALESELAQDDAIKSLLRDSLGKVVAERDAAQVQVVELRAKLLENSTEILKRSNAVFMEIKSERDALTELLAEACDYFTDDEPLAEDSPAGDMLQRMRAALAAKGK